MTELKYKRVPTTYEVYRAILNAHATVQPYDVSVYESYTDIVENGVSTIYTVWGLKEYDMALVGAETKYESALAIRDDGTFYDKEIEGTRTSTYWLCAAYVDEEDSSVEGYSHEGYDDNSVGVC